MAFILFSFQISKYYSYIDIFTVIRKESGSLFCLDFEEKKLIDWDFLFINYIYKRFFKKEK